MCKVKEGKERGEDIGTARFIDFLSHGRYHVTRVETAKLWRSGSMGLVRWDQRTENKWIVFKGHCIRSGGGKLLIQWDRSMNDYVRRVLREHDQEADHLANLGAEGQRHITVVKGDSAEN